MPCFLDVKDLVACNCSTFGLYSNPTDHLRRWATSSFSFPFLVEETEERRKRL